MHYMSRSTKDRHHRLIGPGQCMEEHAGHAMKYYEDKNNAAYMTQIMEYLYAHRMDNRIPDNRLDQHTGHPGFADYIRDELLHA